MLAQTSQGSLLEDPLLAELDMLQGYEGKAAEDGPSPTDPHTCSSSPHAKRGGETVVTSDQAASDSQKAFTAQHTPNSGITSDLADDESAALVQSPTDDQPDSSSVLADPPVDLTPNDNGSLRVLNDPLTSPAAEDAPYLHVEGSDDTVLQVNKIHK